DTKTCNYEDAKARRRTHVFHEAHETTKPRKRRGGSTRRRAAAASGIENRSDEQTLRLCVCASSRFSMPVTAACSAGRSASNQKASSCVRAFVAAVSWFRGFVVSWRDLLRDLDVQSATHPADRRPRGDRGVLRDCAELLHGRQFLRGDALQR